jgi:alpha-galactosidase
VFDLVRDIQKLWPQALLINFANPELLELGKYTSVRALGLCHGIFMGQSDVARILGVPSEEVDVWGAGINHFQCLV